MAESPSRSLTMSVRAALACAMLLPTRLSAQPPLTPCPGASRAGMSCLDLGTLGGTDSVATAMNNLGQVVGSSTTATVERQAFLWTDACRRHDGLGDATGG